MVGYAKITIYKRADTVKRLFLKYGIQESNITLDESAAPKNISGVYLILRNSLKEHETFVTDSLSSLGKTAREINKELSYLKSKKVKLVVLDMPSTMTDKIETIDVLCDMYKMLAEKEIANVKRKQQEGIDNARMNNKKLGRRRILYPENWQECFAKWERKEISSKEFMEMTGLKKGTFYHLVSEYKGNLMGTHEAVPFVSQKRYI